MQEENRDRGLVVIGMHIEKNRSRDEVIESCRRHGLNFPVYIDGYVGSIYIKGTPQAFVFNHDGEIVYDGTELGTLETAVEKALAAAPDWIAGPQEYVKVASEAELVRKRKDLGGVAKTLRAMLDGEDAQGADEARELLERLEKHAGRLMRRADGFVESGEPDRAIEAWENVARLFCGDSIGKGASEIIKTKKKDKAFAAELAALKYFQALMTASEKVRTFRRGQDLEDWKRKNAPELGVMKVIFSKMEKKCDGTKVHQRAVRLMQSLGM